MGKVMRDAGFILSERASGSSFVDGVLRREAGGFRLPQVGEASIPVVEERVREKSMFDELNTPLDEI